MAKYGSFKYGGNTYGKTVETGKSSISIIGKLNLMRIFLSYVGNSELNISSKIIRQIKKSKLSNINIIGTFSRISSMKRDLFGNVTIEGDTSRIVTFRRKAGDGIATLYCTASRTIKKIVGFSSSFTYGSFKYGERKYTMNTWIHGSVNKHSTHSTGNGNIGISKVLKKVSSLFSGLGNVSINKFFYKCISLFSGKGSISPIKLFQKVMKFKRNAGNGTVNIFKTRLKRLHYYFLITLDNILLPLGLRVTRDSRQDIFPSVKENTENIPGKDGEIKFDSNLSSKLLELHVVNDEYNDNLEQARRQYSEHLNPTKGTKPLIFEHDDNKAYFVRYDGKITPSQYPKWMQFVIPFKISNPFAVGTYENELKGSGVATNEGNTETELIIILSGPLTNPLIKLGDNIISYTGSISNNSNVVINTSEGTATLNGTTNVLDNISGDIPYSLPPGDTVIVADSKIGLYWRSRWI